MVLAAGMVAGMYNVVACLPTPVMVPLTAGVTYYAYNLWAYHTHPNPPPAWVMAVDDFLFRLCNPLPSPEKRRLIERTSSLHSAQFDWMGELNSAGEELRKFCAIYDQIHVDAGETSPERRSVPWDDVLYEAPYRRSVADTIGHWIEILDDLEKGISMKADLSRTAIDTNNVNAEDLVSIVSGMIEEFDRTGGLNNITGKCFKPLQEVSPRTVSLVTRMFARQLRELAVRALATAKANGGDEHVPWKFTNQDYDVAFPLLDDEGFINRTVLLATALPKDLKNMFLGYLKVTVFLNANAIRRTERRKLQRPCEARSRICFF